MKINSQQSKTYIDLSKKDRNISNKQANTTSTRTGGTTINKAHSE